MPISDICTLQNNAALSSLPYIFAMTYVYKFRAVTSLGNRMITYIIYVESQSSLFLLDGITQSKNFD